MLFPNSTAQLIADGVLEVHRSSTKTSRKTLRMQIDEIYSNKIESIVREITANAFDSHLRAKQLSRAFFVHAPTATRPEFYVRDYGVGMTHQVMTQGYIVIGHSDKDQSNDEVGMWGLGSKVPFAYSDHYTIACYDGERVRHYGYAIAEDGVPDLMLMSDEPCDEPAGVRIGLAVETKDFEAFAKAVRRIHMAHKGGFETNVQDLNGGKAIFNGADWTAYSDLGDMMSGWQTPRVFARQGCVLYPVQHDKITLMSSSTREHRFILDCPIGSIRMTPSREAIQYDDAVVSYLNDRLQRVHDETADAVWEKIKDIPTAPAFFAALATIKPDYVKRDYEHPASGLSSAALTVDGHQSIMDVTYNPNSDQWTFKHLRTKALAQFSKAQVILLNDISPLLDPSRNENTQGDDGSWMTRSEDRRLARFLRAYLTREVKEERVTSMFTGEKPFIVLLNMAYTPEQQKAIFGDALVSAVTFDDLREALPKRALPPQTSSLPPIKGLALAKAAGEQRPVFTLEPAQAGQAWIKGEVYRHHASALFKVARTFDITHLYIVGGDEVEQKMIAHGVPPLADAVHDFFAKQGLTIGDWHGLRDMSHSLKNYRTWLREAHKAAPAAVKSLMKREGLVSDITGGLMRSLHVELPSMTPEQEKATNALLGVSKASSEDLRLAEAAWSKATQDYYHPSGAFLKALQAGHGKEHHAATLSLLGTLQSKLPFDVKF
ncbi:histidine kinase [Brevundimonas phage vB_BpoS-Kikimora]|uniref:Histidine kinase n=1 Tax=Brevundimonas phage vB_BpoS-Kikimora TaxID=2948601 RepID=A0A9E7MRQ5_9CAUD|nr:histidine kinase [Brevundimonas phage vB_BpoS-Kikimora]